jgi:TRAP-type C4-dicarboxylate transport system substrate-binding protein
VTQWNTQVKDITDLPLVYVGGALLVDKKVFGKIPGPLQEKVRQICAKHIRRLIEKTRQDNRDAYELIVKRGVTKITPTPQQTAEFKALSDSVVAGLDPSLLPRSTFDRVKAELAEYRATHPAKPERWPRREKGEPRRGLPVEFWTSSKAAS